MAMAAWIPMAMMAAGSIISAVGSISQGNAANDIAQANAREMEKQGALDRKEAAAEAERIRRENRRLSGTARTQLTASGLSPNLLLLEDIAMEGELDALIAEYRGERSAQGLEAQADIERAYGKAQKRAGYFNAASTLLTAGGSFMRAFSGGGGGGSLSSANRGSRTGNWGSKY